MKLQYIIDVDRASQNVAALLSPWPIRPCICLRSFITVTHRNIYINQSLPYNHYKYTRIYGKNGPFVSFDNVTVERKDNSSRGTSADLEAPDSAQG